MTRTHGIGVILEKTLSDGSKVFDVSIAAVRLSAVTEADALEFIEKVNAALEAHTLGPQLQ